MVEKAKSDGSGSVWHLSREAELPKRMRYRERLIKYKLILGSSTDFKFLNLYELNLLISLFLFIKLFEISIRFDFQIFSNPFIPDF